MYCILDLECYTMSGQRKSKKKNEKRDWFIVYSDYGYFKGLANGGQLIWTQDETEAKPLDHPNKMRMIKFLAPKDIEVILENI
jgi:hypothetical protein